MSPEFRCVRDYEGEEFSPVDGDEKGVWKGEEVEDVVDYGDEDDE